MSTIRNRLKDQRGVSIFMGLIFLMVCIVVGTVVLTAATAAAGKLAQQRENEQDYQTVASAARLLKNRIGVLTYTHTATSINGNSPDTSADLTVTPPTSDEAILSKELLALCKVLTEESTETAAVDPLSTGTDTGKKFTVQAPSADSKPVLETVYGWINVEKDGRILVKLWLNDNSADDPADPADLTDLTDPADPATDPDDPKSHNLVEMEFTPDGPTENTVVDTQEDESSGTFTETIIVTTTCSWPEDQCTIRKGTSKKGTT